MKNKYVKKIVAAIVATVLFLALLPYAIVASAEDYSINNKLEEKMDLISPLMITVIVQSVKQKMVYMVLFLDRIT